MSYSYQVWFLVPIENLSEGRFERMVPALKGLPKATMGRGFSPEEPSAPLFSKTSSPELAIDGWDCLFEASTGWDDDMDEEEVIGMPEAVGLFSISIDGDALGRYPEIRESFAQAMVASFDGLGALIALLGTAEDYSAITDTRQMYTLPAPEFMMTGKDLIMPDEREALSRLFEHSGETDLGYWYRTGSAYEDGLDETSYPRFRAVLGSIWERDPRLHGGLEVEGLEVGEAAALEAEVGPEEAPLFELDPATGSIRFIHHGEGPGGAFVWFYYPRERHTLDACRAFLHHLFFTQDRIDNMDPQTRAILERSAHDLHTGHLDLRGPVIYIRADDEGMEVRVSMEMVVTSGTDRIAPFSPTLSRQGCVSLLLTFLGESGQMSYVEHRSALIEVIENLINSFGLIFGFGFRGYNTFVDMYEGMTPPEQRYWPYSIYDINAFPQNREWCSQFAQQNSDDWMFWIVDESHVALLNKDLSTTL